MHRMNDPRRPTSWRRRAAKSVAQILNCQEDNYAFLATGKVTSHRWTDHAFKTGDLEESLFDHFTQHNRRDFDHYFCVNAFSKPVRKAVHMHSSCCAWVDIDDADPAKFDPQPNILVRTSPGRHQGIWLFTDTVDRDEAELYSKALAYRFGADKNGWSATKYLRVPFTYNHKAEYDRPLVKLLEMDLTPQQRKAAALPRAIRRCSSPIVIESELKISKNWRKIYRAHRDQLHARVRFLVESDRAYVFERDRSKCIFEIVVGMAEAGANPNEIASVLGHNPYFISKYCRNEDKLNQEISRILGKIGGAS